MWRTGDVVGVCVDVGHDEGLALLPCLAAHAATVGDAGAGGWALEWAEYELAAADKVKADPMPVEMVLEGGGGVGQVGDGVGFAFE